MLRKLKIKTLHGEIHTPAFLPDATYGAVNSLSFADVHSTNTKELVTTTLHLEEKLGSQYIKDFGGLHKFFNWQRPILTDSGGFQVFSLIHRRASKANFITDEGAQFKNPLNGSISLLTPESSQQIQANLGSDIRVVLDEPLSLGADSAVNLASVTRTTAWAERSRNEFLKQAGLADLAGAAEEVGAGRPLLTAVVQGARDFELRKRSANELIELGFDGYNFGGLPLTPEGKLDTELSQYLVDLLPEDKIRYAMGIGTPDDIIELAHMGWDLFDCVLPTRNARHGYLFVPLGEGDVDYKHYSVLHLKSQRYAHSEEAISKSTHPLLEGVSRAYLRHLIRINEPAGFRLATIHNLHFYQEICEKLRSGEL